MVQVLSGMTVTLKDIEITGGNGGGGIVNNGTPDTDRLHNCEQSKKRLRRGYLEFW